MVAPLIIIIIIAGIGSALLFTEAGDIVSSALEQTGLTDPDAYDDVTIQEQDQEIEEEIVGGFENFIHEMVQVGGDLGQESIEASDFEGNPIGMTEAEAVDIKNKGIEFFGAFADVFFTGHAFIVSVINGLSPVDMGIALVSIIALLVSLFMIFSHAKHMGKHWAIIVMVVSFFILFFIVIGGNEVSI